MMIGNVHSPYLRFDLQKVKHNAKIFRQHCFECFPSRRVKIFFAMKAHPASSVLRALKPYSIGTEAMTLNELTQAIENGSQVIVSGFYKSSELIRLALKHAEYLVVETEHELDHIQQLAQGNPVSIALRVRLDDDRKLGCGQEAIQRILKKLQLNSMSHFKLVGLHYHAGWNITDERIISEHVGHLLWAYELVTKKGIDLSFMNLGGSFCESSADPDQLSRRFTFYNEKLPLEIKEIHFEPGRYLVGNAGTIYATVVHVDRDSSQIWINTCAYGYKLTGATPRLSLGDDAAQDNIWTILGFWPSESDRLENISLCGDPKVGDQIALENMGAYVWGLQHQFDAGNGIQINYEDGSESH